MKKLERLLNAPEGAVKRFNDEIRESIKNKGRHALNAKIQGRKKGDLKMLNNISLQGRLTTEPQLRYYGDANIPCVRFSIANQESRKINGEYKVNFIRCVAWRGTAEHIVKYFKKGSMILISGSLSTGSYERDDGIKINTYEVYVKEVNFSGEGRREDKPEEYEQTAPEQTSAPGNTPVPAPAPEIQQQTEFPADDYFPEIPDEDDADLPF